ncbi:MAG: branched-chain amino acid transaminase, partial [Ktedonobacterales bacterium]
MSSPALSQRSDMVVFLNGTYLPANQAHVGVMTHALSYGTGVFEGLRGYRNDEANETYIFRAREHFERMHRSCRIMNMTLPYSVDELVEVARQLVRRNGLRENCYIRPFAYKSDEIIGVRLHDLEDHFTMYAVPMGDYVATTGLRTGVSSWRRVDDNMIPARAKISGAYVNSAFAKTEALKNGFDEAIMLTAEGHVSEGSAENIFLLLNNELVTPAPSENILLGVTRDTVIQLARREMDRITRERQIDRTELYCADEILLTGTGAQIAPVVEVDHRPIGTGKVGPLAAEMQRLYAEVVRGKRAEYMDWCVPAFGDTAHPTTTSEPPRISAHNGNSNGNGNGHKPSR